MADKTGFLVKEGGKFKTWKKRWFVLKNGVIYYSKKEVCNAIGQSVNHLLCVLQAISDLHKKHPMNHKF